MNTTLHSIVDAFTHRHADLRLHCVSIEIEEMPDRIVLKGEVLEQSQLEELRTEITAAHPGVVVDAAQVRVLRKPNPVFRYVSTNFTSLHKTPSWLTEMFSELFYGTRLEILKEKEGWAFARQDDGYLGWVYLAYTSSQSPLAPTHFARRALAALHSEPKEDAAICGRLYVGMPVHVAEIRAGWARVAPHPETQPASLSGGWVRTEALLAKTELPKNSQQKRERLVEEALRLVGVPYLWGGCTSSGIDCSGLARLVHRLAGMEIERDADMQHDSGRPVEFPYQPGDLLFFGENGEKRVVTHVAVSQGGWKIVHSSRSRNGVYEDDVQAVEHLKESFLGACTYVE